MITRRASRRAPSLADGLEISDEQTNKSTANTKTKIKNDSPRRQAKKPKTNQTKQALSTKESGSKDSVSRRTNGKSTTKQPLQQETAKETPRKKLRREPLIFDTHEKDPVIEHLEHFYQKYSHYDRRTNFNAEILDQIALEGLSGVTLRRLFRILNAVIPSFNCLTDQNCQIYVWSVIVNRYLQPSSGTSVQAFYYDLKERSSSNRVERPETASGSQPTSTTKGILIDKPIKLPDSAVQRLASYDSSLYPVQDGSIKGSCAHYLTRLDISHELIDGGGTLESMQRMNDLYGLENIFFVANQAVRNRAILPNWVDPNIDIKLREYCALEWIGKSRTLGLVFPKDKAFGRYRIMLLAKGFITQFQLTNSSPIEHHLRRFSFVLLAVGSESVCRTTLDSSRGAGDGDLGEDESEDSGRRKMLLSKLCCNPDKLKIDRGVLTMVYDVIAESDGITQLDIRQQLNMPKFHLRNHLKNLISLKLVCSRPCKDPDSAFRLFYTAHKTIRTKKSQKKQAKPTGIMASWDEADLRAKRIIGRRRSSFSQAEDSLLILCRITSILIEPKVSRLSWCVNKRLVRDLLHKELVESHDKTSDACLRRIKYLKRLPNNIMSINELTAELRDDAEIVDLIEERDRRQLDEKQLNRLYTKVLKLVRSKIPNLLGISSSLANQTSEAFGKSLLDRTNPRPAGNNKSSSAKATDEEPIEGQPKLNDNLRVNIKSHADLKKRYELLDCQLVASISRAPTYERAKNSVDVKFNNVCLVTMAYTLFNCFEHLYGDREEGGSSKRTDQWLLDKFYSNYPDKLVSSALSKLNKRSLLTRKTSAGAQSVHDGHQSTGLFKVRTSKLSLKLNQTVLFLLNRYHSSSLIQLANPINQLFQIDLSESNEMASIALLTSLCSLSSFELDLKLKIPANVVGIDQGNENFRSLCNKANEGTRAILARFMSRCSGAGPILGGRSILAPPTRAQTSEQPLPVASTSNSSVSVSSSKSSLTQNRSRKGRSAAVVVANESNLDDTNPSHQSQPAATNELRTEEPTSTAGATPTAVNSKMDDSRRALFLLRHELKTQALDKCGSLSDCLIVQPCNVKFYSEHKRLQLGPEPMELFFERAKPAASKQPNSSEKGAKTGSQQPHINWLVKSYQLPSDKRKRLNSERDFETHKRSVEFEARLWKRIDGHVHVRTLLKLIESLLSWVIVYPGIESRLLKREFGHLMPDEHLFELLELMESLELISSKSLKANDRVPRLFGYSSRATARSGPNETSITYEPTASAYVQYCQLLDYCNNRLEDELAAE